MNDAGFTLFDTPIGRCGIAWGEHGIRGVQLPEASETDTRARMRQRFPDLAEGLPPAVIQRAVARIGSLLGGRKTDLSGLLLDMTGVPEFHRRVYEAARAIGPGATLSYGEVASRLGTAGAARAVGQALGRNPFAIVVPCHRVLAAGGNAGGFTANGGLATKRRLLELEGARLPPGGGPARAPRPAWAPSPAAADPGAAGFQFDPGAAIAQLRAADPTLARLIDAVGPFRMEVQRTSSVFVALAEAIVYQQLTGKAAATIYGRVCALFPRTRGGPTAAHLLGASDEALRGAGLSRAKAAALRDLARRTSDGELPTLARIRRMSDDEIVEQLTQVRGIGRWTVEMLLIFRLGRPDVLPVDDYGVRKGFASAYRRRELPTPKELARIGERWAPHRTVASWYLWRAVDLAKG